MTSSSLLLLALAVHPVQSFLDAHPGATALPAAGGERLVHASGFLFDPRAASPEEAAAAFLGRHGAAFGVTARQVLLSKGAPASGGPGAVRFERRIDGLPVFGGDLVLGVDAENRVFVVNGGDVPAVVSGRHLLGAARARDAALSSLSGAGQAAVTAGWRRLGGVVRAVYRVDVVAEQPAGDWRVFVDAEAGTVLFREDLRYRVSVPGSVFEVSPVETAAAPCPIGMNGAHTFCASPVIVSFPNLSTGADLAGAQTSVFNCNGANAPTNPATFPGACTSVAAASGNFDFAADGTFQSTTDPFAAGMAYYHLDKHVSFFKSIDATLPGGPSRALNGSLPAVVNAFQGGAPLNNAFFSGGLDAMVFGQGTSADFAYDATVMYHEFTHGVVFAWGGFNPDIDGLGGLWEPAAVNEGSADSMAVSETGRSEVGAFLGATLTTPTAALRDMNDPDAARSCHGNGTLITQFGAPNLLNGLDGEEHDDGEIWNGLFWEVFDGLRAAGLKSCGGSCDAGAALQYRAIQFAGGTSPTLHSYWQTLEAAATAIFPAPSGAAAYVDCVGKRRSFDRCDRTFPMFAGESKAEMIRVRYSPFQVALQATGATQFRVCSALGTSTAIYVRKGTPVQLTAIDPFTGNATVTADGSAVFSTTCSGGSVLFSLPSAGTWYLLLDSGLLPPSFDIYKIDASPNGMSARPASQAPPTCTPPFIAIAPASASLPPRGSLGFTASGGSGEGYAWTLDSSASGGNMGAGGGYTAGATGSVTDVVRVTDSLGNTTTRNVTVTAGVSISPPSPSAATGGSITFTASGGSGTGFTWALQTNASGGSINAAGVYMAGATGNVTDAIQVTDSLGNTAVDFVAVTAGGGGGGGGGGSSGGGCGCGTGGGAMPILALGIAALLRRARGKGATRSS